MRGLSFSRKRDLSKAKIRERKSMVFIKIAPNSIGLVNEKRDNTKEAEQCKVMEHAQCLEPQKCNVQRNLLCVK